MLTSENTNPAAHLGNIDSVVGIALMNIPNRSEAYDVIAKVLGASRNTAKKLCYMYGYRASNTALRKALVEDHQTEHTITSVINTKTNDIVYRLENAKVMRGNGIFTVQNGKEKFSGNSSDFYVVVNVVPK